MGKKICQSRIFLLNGLVRGLVLDGNAKETSTLFQKLGIETPRSLAEAVVHKCEWLPFFPSGASTTTNLAIPDNGHHADGK